MTDILLVKNYHALKPADEKAEQWLSKIGQGEAIQVRARKYRNLSFHRKFFALVNYAFDMWQPPELPDDPGRPWMKDISPTKNLDRFRKDMTILAGFYESYYRLDGTVRVEAKSIAFDKMDEDEFSELYSRMIDVILEHICVGMDSDQLSREILEFA